MIRHRKRQPGDDHIGQRLARNIHPHPKAVRAKEDAARCCLELLEQTASWGAASLYQQIEFLSCKKFLHLIGHLMHAAIIREEDKGASFRFFDKMRDPMLERFLVTRVPRVGHFLHNEQLHLGAKIKWAPE